MAADLKVVQLADRGGDSKTWSAIAALEDLIKYIKDNDLDVDRLAVHYIINNPDGTRRHCYQAQGLDFPKHIALLEVGKYKVVQDFCGDS